MTSIKDRQGAADARADRIEKAAWSIRPSGFFAVHGHPGRKYGAAPEGADRASEHQHTTDGAGSQGPPGKFPENGQSRPGRAPHRRRRCERSPAGWAALTARL